MHQLYIVSFYYFYPFKFKYYQVYEAIFLHSFLIFNFITLSRLFINFIRNLHLDQNNKQKVIVYGAGNYAVSVIELLKKNYHIVGLIDDIKINTILNQWYNNLSKRLHTLFTK